jgi:hypothetical protein
MHVPVEQTIVALALSIWFLVCVVIGSFVKDDDKIPKCK